MKVKFLGTSGAENYPSLWCECKNCRYAREHKGKNIRFSTSMFIEPDILIDFPPTLHYQALTYNVALSRIKHLFFTHSHEDHFYPSLIRWRYSREYAHEENRYFSNKTTLPILYIYGTDIILESIKKSFLYTDIEPYRVEFVPIMPYDEITIDKKRSVVPVLGNHFLGDVYPFNYIFKIEDKYIFYALDSDWPLPDTIAYIGYNRIAFDLVVVEATGGDLPREQIIKGHMNFDDNIRLFKFFKEQKFLKEGGIFALSHFTHYAPPYDLIVERFAEIGITVSYDGMEIDI